MSFKKLGEIKPGDVIIGSDNKEVTVIDAYDSHIPEKMYEIELNNGSFIKASGNHLWYVVTDLDYSLHRSRIKTAKKLLSKLTDVEKINLYNVATSETEVETSLIDMVHLISAQNNRPLTQVLVRVAESIGHIAETKMEYQDVSTGEMIEEQIDFRTYDARVFSQQILSLAGKKEHKNKWSIIKGRVVNTNQLTLLGEDIEIPLLEEYKK